jgi:hypothetical protein
MVYHFEVILRPGGKKRVRRKKRFYSFEGFSG